MWRGVVEELRNGSRGRSGMVIEDPAEGHGRASKEGRDVDGGASWDSCRVK